MKLMRLPWLPLLVAVALNPILSSGASRYRQIELTNDPASGSSICILPSGERSASASDCSTGEVHLIGKYVNLGIHNVGSFGTISTLASSYYTGQLGFIADYDRNGFSSLPSPGFTGDYFIPGSPMEGRFLLAPYNQRFTCQACSSSSFLLH